MSPIGGMIADRFRKQRVMFWLDAATTVLILVYIVASGFVTAVLPIVIVKLMALNAIQGVYMPAVSSSVPLIVGSQKLVSANAVVNLVNSISGMAGMAIAGVLFARFGIFPILAVSAVCFAITACMDLLIRVPFTPLEGGGGIVKIVKGDLRQAGNFILENTIILKCAIIAFLISFSIISLILVGIPVIVTQYLEMDMGLVGVSQGFTMGGGVLGGIVAGVMGSRLKLGHAYISILAAGLLLVPVGLVLLFGLPVFVVYVTLTASCTLAFACITVANVQVITTIQGRTPVELIGKVISVIVMLPFLANALGQFVYGLAFERFASMPHFIVFVTVGVTVGVAWLTRHSVVENEVVLGSSAVPA